MLTFKECTLDQLDETFGLKPLPLNQMPVLQTWLDGQSEISEQERGYLATREDVFDIFRILKVLKQMIIERVRKQSGKKGGVDIG
ncbi:hypothetical protein QUF72_11210 [Desulfobacterales bacterium HSG2]|nr:hypothetical protein [Desulfobacterales bacterium HSG2]